MHLEYDHDFDKNGLIYHLGSRHAPVHPMYEGAKPQMIPKPLPEWMNPSKSGRLRVICGANGADGGGMHTAVLCSREDVLERDHVGDCFFFRDGWFGVDLGNATKVRPEAYTIRQGGEGRVMVSWVFEGAENSQDGPWIVLDTHTRDDALLNGVWAGSEGSASRNYRFSRTFVCGDGACPQPSQGIEKKVFASRSASAGGSFVGQSGLREIGAGKKSFRFVRVRQLENDSDPDDPRHEPGWMWVQGFEVYGTLVVSDVRTRAGHKDWEGEGDDDGVISE